MERTLNLSICILEKFFWNKPNNLYQLSYVGNTLKVKSIDDLQDLDPVTLAELGTRRGSRFSADGTPLFLKGLQDILTPGISTPGISTPETSTPRINPGFFNYGLFNHELLSLEIWTINFWTMNSSTMNISSDSTMNSLTLWSQKVWGWNDQTLVLK